MDALGAGHFFDNPSATTSAARVAAALQAEGLDSRGKPAEPVMTGVTESMKFEHVGFVVSTICAWIRRLGADCSGPGS